LLRRAAPDARLLVLLRDPVERYRSGLAHDLARGRAFDAELAQDHFARGLYHAQLRRLLDHFPAESLLVLQYERCIAEPEAELARTYEHIGVDPSFRPEVTGRVLETKGPKPTLDDAATAALRDAYRDDVAALASAFPQVDLDRWPHFAGRG
jgi:hypothetical protein